MAAASDKARFYLEQSVAELKEFEQKKIFSSSEIRSIARQRSNFEHKINARGSTPSDYARYAEFEINVESLRKMRARRKGIKATTHNGPRRIFFVFDRGAKKHPGDLGLWLQFIEHAKQQKAHKKLSQIFTNVLRLHPTRPELWIYAAQFAMEEHGDMTEARGYIQRGLRFNKNKKQMWLQYERLELSYIAKIHARREILGISPREESNSDDRDHVLDESLSRQAVAPDLEGDEPDEHALNALASVPAAEGAIPIAIFDAGMAQFNDDLDMAIEMLECLHDFAHLPATRTILRHMQQYSQSRPTLPQTVELCEIWTPTIGLDPQSAQFPTAMRQSLALLKKARGIAADDKYLLDWAKKWLECMLDFSELDEALKTVAKALLTQWSD